jgi:hypothetical protein
VNLQECIRRILKDWPTETQKPFLGNPLGDFIRRDFANTVSEIALMQNPNLKVKASPGAGNWASVPWLSIIDPIITKSTQDGIYPVYLFMSDGTGVYLSLNQGTTIPRQTLGKQKAGLREKGIIDFLISNIPELKHLNNKKLNLKTHTPLGKSYETPNIGSYFYPVEDIPSNDKLEADLASILSIYKSVVKLWPKISSIDTVFEPANEGDVGSIFVTNGKKSEESSISIPKPFILLAGISGTGKTRFVRKQANQSCPASVQKEKYNYCLVPVRPDWHEPSDLMGFVSRINGTKYIPTDFLKFIIKALAAAIESVDKDKIQWKDFDTVPPFWLCLDEMNLAPVEQYFSDYLSILETREWLNGEYKSDSLIGVGLLEQLDKSELNDGSNSLEALWDELFFGVHTTQKDELCAYFLGNGVPLPPNLIVAGTVNMDETTHGFSRKVIDRALTLDFQEFFPNEYDKYFSEQIEPVTINFPTISDARPYDYAGNDLEDAKEKSRKFLTDLNLLLKGTPFELAYRALNELMLSVICFAPYKEGEAENKLFAVWDDFLMQKVLPRIEGDSQKLKFISEEGQGIIESPTLSKESTKYGAGSVLHQVYALLETNHLQAIWSDAQRPDLLRDTTDPILCRSRIKLEWMMKRLKANHFTDFWV